MGNTFWGEKTWKIQEKSMKTGKSLYSDWYSTYVSKTYMYDTLKHYTTFEEVQGHFQGYIQGHMLRWNLVKEIYIYTFHQIR